MVSFFFIIITTESLLKTILQYFIFIKMIQEMPFKDSTGQHVSNIAVERDTFGELKSVNFTNKTVTSKLKKGSNNYIVKAWPLAVKFQCNARFKHLFVSFSIHFYWFAINKKTFLVDIRSVSSPDWGRDMGKDFLKFLDTLATIYFGFWVLIFC